MTALSSVAIARLVHRAQLHSDNAAFSALIAEHQSRLRSFLLRLCKDYDSANDIAQETFIIAHKKLHTFNGSGDFSSWLFTIAYRCFLQAQRSNKRRIEIAELYAKDHVVDVQSYESISTAQIDLERAMLTLKQAEIAAISLCHSYGFSHAEVADILETPLGTVKSNINRGKQKLRELLVLHK